MERKKFRFRKVVNDIPLNYKFSLIYIIGVLLPIIIINLVFLDRISDLIKSREQQNLEISLERARKDIHDFIEGGVAVSYTLSADKNLYELLERTYGNSIEFYDTFDEQLRGRMNSYMPVNNQIERITVFTNNDSIVSGSNYQVINEKVMNSEWYKQSKAANKHLFLAAYHMSDISSVISTAPYLSVIERMDAYSSYNKFEKLLRIDLDLSKIYDVIIREKDYLSLYLVNEQDEIIMSAQSGYQRGTTEPYPVFKLQDDERKEDVHIVPVGGASYIKGWRIIGITQGERIAQAIMEIRIYAGILASIVTLITTAFLYVMLRSYNYRVKRLSRHMQKVSNEKFELIRIDEGQDEIGGLIRNFNRMTTTINSLINDVYKLEIQKNNLEMERVRAELNFLQSQMNPHFLFNTLNAILVVCTKNNYSDVTDIIKSLSKLLRRLLSWKEDLVTLEEEMTFIEMYLKIEKFRFRDKFDYQFEIDEQSLQYKIPKLSMQPLVENSCKHGLQAIEGLGVIKVKTLVEEGRLKVTVSDNGKGIEPEKLQELLGNVQNEASSGTNIGIRNVYRRLELYYEDQVRFDISSVPDEGTIVTFDIPLKLLERKNS
ncbi:histidine kinase [Paenibacillus sp. FSL R5-0887]|jgi:two-component system sensor histidine kinase YesM|uniref:sensor histidine kinase n=1 Tax=Paenibacillus TaxID=44249 RepID=UPI00096D233D|nr:sensor histidine kinase [Paenibacillus odorifer]OMC68154.1 two-component sensor histidine kinase [Paenibacillus odorifer]OMC76086.1 two-component sensor histidine kinase [Paenibacillus odorifer]OMD58394.1 two-component sensor histidine kinase [Paenibacillus odorifer]OMD78365.1 two-component sensor histidine kinase [Paenibacillus odorifer]OME01769.1 two-component sensor histidine kinase [Paenibacillus odorifer]